MKNTTLIERLTSLETFSAGVGLTWTLVLFTGTATFEKSPELFAHIARFGGEITWGIAALIYAVISLSLNFFVDAFPSSIVNTVTFSIFAGLLWFGTPFSQVAVAYTLLSMMNLVRCVFVNYPRMMGTAKFLDKFDAGECKGSTSGS